MSFVYLIPCISKPRVTSSNLVGRAKPTALRLTNFRCCTKDSIQIYFYLLISKSLASMTVYIESNPNLLANLNSLHLDSFYIVLRRLITFSSQRTVHSLFHMESYIARTARTRFSLASNSLRSL